MEAGWAVGGTGDIAIGIAIGAVGAFVATGISLFVARLVGPRRWQRTMWAFRVPAHRRPRIIVETLQGHETEIYKRPEMGFGVVAAVSQLSTALNASRSGFLRRRVRSLEHPVELAFSSEQKADDWFSHADTVVVGGPKSNAKTAELLLAFGCQSSGTDRLEEDELLRRTADLRQGDGSAAGLGLATQGNTIYWFGASYAGTVQVAEDPAPGTVGYNGDDYGVVLRLPSSTDLSRRTVVLFGSQTFGVDAASSWLVNLRSRKTLRKVSALMAKKKNIAVLVKAKVVDGSLQGPPDLCEIVALPDDLSPRHW